MGFGILNPSQNDLLRELGRRNRSTGDTGDPLDCAKQAQLIEPPNAAHMKEHRPIPAPDKQRPIPASGTVLELS
jgi:hypothetical protein